MLYFDTHAHYDWEEFDEDRETLFKEFENKLCGIVNVGINKKSINKAIEYAKRYSFMYFSIGIHPMEVEKSIPIQNIEQIIKKEKESDNSKLVAIGETGLDYHFCYPKDLQEKYFIEQISLANKYDLPIIIHSRESQEDVERILREHPVEKAGIMHCYSGSVEQAKRFLKMGYYIGVGGPVTRYKDIQETVKITPIDRIVIETDAPVLPPEPFEKHSRNNSLYIKHIVKKIAQIKNLSEEDVIKHTTQNAYKIYGI